MIGSPPNCRPECYVNADCPTDRACINRKCQDPCPGLCGVNAQCKVQNHIPVCTCIQGYIGDPFAHCYKPSTTPIPIEVVLPCSPSPCGINAECSENRGAASCRCIRDYVGNPYVECKPECVVNPECPRDKACINNKCGDPCPGVCGVHASCRVTSHVPQCKCDPGYTGDAFVSCQRITTPQPIIPQPVDPCNPSPCGSNAVCQRRGDAAACQCIRDYFGDPYVACRPECTTNAECPSNKACQRFKCIDPCPQAGCGVNANCQTVNHIPNCICNPGYIGDPFSSCRRPVVPSIAPVFVDPCEPNPCGPNSNPPRVIGERCQCSCLPEMIGSPPNCRPECIINSDCSADKACINQKCQDPCPGLCGVNAYCRVRNHIPICVCNKGYQGDPFSHCRRVTTPQPRPEIIDPCRPSPCGVNAECRENRGAASCTCLPGLQGDPYIECRHECTINSECATNLACINNKCKDPCPGVCGAHATCSVNNHYPICKCDPGFIGDPFTSCRRKPEPPIQTERIDPCNPSPCGSNAVCSARSTAASCQCIPEYFGDPYVACRPECIINADCPSSKTCRNKKCVDPCPGLCGRNANCQVANHIPICICNQGYIGDPFTACRKEILPTAPVIVEDPCVPNPCGPNSNPPRRSGDRCQCTCLPEMIGSPPNCRPECVINADCSQDTACINQKCQDPCPGVCGVNAYCRVRNHIPICVCNQGYIGDPFSSCYLKPSTQRPIEVVQPCNPSPCGINAECREVGKSASCTCIRDYTGNPYIECKPECVVNAECPRHLACINQHCRDPCPGVCGAHATCSVTNHIPLCRCDSGYEGDAFVACRRITTPAIPTEVIDPCNPTPCGSNAVCTERSRAAACQCIPEYFGDPYVACRPECTINADCPSTKACQNLHCVDPCPGVCGVNANCKVINHIPSCTCNRGYRGDPFTACSLIPQTIAPVVVEDPCVPNPCGPNSQPPRNVGTRCQCNCLPEMIGSPPNCRPECTINSDCAQDRACINRKCQDPCPGLCGINAYCRVRNHVPICVCNQGYIGDPFSRCSRPITTTPRPDIIYPCNPSPCGINAVCNERQRAASCTCLPGLQGDPYIECKPECSINSECASHLACIQNKCKDPCPGVCGAHARCSVQNHSPICRCDPGYIGDPFSACYIPPTTPTPPPRDPCNPNPCGANADPAVRSNTCQCTCRREYFGDPYSGCRPECVVNSDCIRTLACSRNKCIDPCPGTCGSNAECRVINHNPVCTCLPNYIGDPFQGCFLKPVPTDPCNPNPCGRGAIPRRVGDSCQCSCPPEYQGDPYTECKPECVVNSDCPNNLACSNYKCYDPCVNICGRNAQCNVRNHSPLCSCLPRYVGNPLIECILPPPVDPIVSDPCEPSPCGLNAIARPSGDRCICTCPPGLQGDPFQECKPECTVDTDCPRTLACVRQKCKNPCVYDNQCGINAICEANNHRANCICPPGYDGDAYQICKPIREPPKPECTIDDECPFHLACIGQKCRDPCIPEQCGSRAVCKVNNHRAVCICPPPLEGNPYTACIEPGCKSDLECPLTQACIERDCQDPCRFEQCGVEALCEARNHRARCYCPPRYRGDPYQVCRKPECTSDPECPQHLACTNEKCVDPCACAINANCIVRSHHARCMCYEGYQGDPYSTGCFPIPEPPRPECTEDSECPSKLACLNEVCKNPCTTLRPCGQNTVCTVIDTLPQRTMICTCLPGYIGDADVHCELPPEPEPGCKSNDECSDQEICRDRNCVNPCIVANPCSPNAICEVRRHRTRCSCPAGTTGDPFSNCYPVEPRPECRTDPECPQDQACINERCINPCVSRNPCAPQARCEAKAHHPVCTCPEGYGGDPYRQCYRPECRTDSECPVNRACINENCLNPCLHSDQQCGRGAECRVDFHKARCVCSAGLQGNPLVACITVGCRTDNDCRQDQACDFLSQKCGPVCLDNTCAADATCRPLNHQPECTCNRGYRGNGFVACILPESPAVAGCRVDDDCGSGLACINSECQDPCSVNRPCHQSQTCKVENSSPIKTVICVCPDDTFIGPNGECRQKVTPVPFCSVDRDCRDPEKCVQGTCRDACYVDPCGSNAICKSRAHDSTCSCPIGYTGNPRVQCTKIPPSPIDPPKPECRDNSECPNYNSCINRQCLNPCAVTDPCATNAYCRVQNHEPVCSCPAGYIGDPRVSCVKPEPPVIGCQSDDDCSQSTACNNRDCVDPCNCGINAQCYVTNHKPVCYCPIGYTGNPEIECRPVGCRSDTECENPEVCINEQCIDACVANNPCAPNAECYSTNHQAACRCPPGLEGDPYQQCIRVECRINQDCSSDSACISNRCVPPCLYENPCAPTATCTVQNHDAKCTCPPHAPIGNPLVSCSPKEAPVVPDPEPDCYVDADCPQNTACLNERCENPCLSLSPCDITAICTVVNSLPFRTMICSCRPGWVPDQDTSCKPLELPNPPGCARDDDCPQGEACVNRQCIDPCDCGSGAQCFVQAHKPLCVCPPGFIGNPNIACEPIGCQSDSECRDQDQCIDRECVPACLVSDNCGQNAECLASGHKAQCICLSGYEGDPYVACTLIGCRIDQECPPDKACRNKDCIDLCLYQNPCGRNCECLMADHTAQCRAPLGFTGNPHVACTPVPAPECVEDKDCPSEHGCLDSKCKHLCKELNPCNAPAICSVIDSLPVRTMICTCPDGYVSDDDASCRTLPPILAGCTTDDDCGEPDACINAICNDPCACGDHASCRVINHKPVCTCDEGYEGNPDIACVKIECQKDDDCLDTHACRNEKCAPVCGPGNAPCGGEAICTAENHKATCACPPGLEGNPLVTCVAIECRSDRDCPADKACYNNHCIPPCAIQNPCEQPAECVVVDHKVNCECPPGFEGSKGTSCTRVQIGCRADEECPSKTACINQQCIPPCSVADPCGINALCEVLDTLPVRTMICTCIAGYQGNAAIECTPPPSCPPGKGLILDENENCVCPEGHYVDDEGYCVRCPTEKGFVLVGGRCICDPSRGLVLSRDGDRCECPPGMVQNEEGRCVECVRDPHCPDDKYCERTNNTCADPCIRDPCGPNAYGTATGHICICKCIEGFIGNPKLGCTPKPTTKQPRGEFPRPDLQVNCLADGVLVEIDLVDANFNGLMYVKGHSKDERCGKAVNVNELGSEVLDFKVLFGTCGLFHSDGEANFILVIQKHPKLVTFKSQAYRIRCVYNTGEHNIQIGFNVSTLTTAGTIANTGPPPTCSMRICDSNGEDIGQAEIGDQLMLKVEVSPNAIYGGFARQCVAHTMDDDGENEYVVTDEHGCATDPKIFNEWDYDRTRGVLTANFDAFKFPASNNIRFQCNIRVCFGQCQPQNCAGRNAYGRKKREAENEIQGNVFTGQLREEIKVQSNAILTIERRTEARIGEHTGDSVLNEEVCVSKIGFIIALVITALLALVAVAIAVSCWLMAYRRRPKAVGPLPHPAEFPNPLYTTPEPMAEPAPDYLS